MSAFQSLTELIRALAPEETEVCRNYLNAFSTRDVKTVKLLDALAARQNHDLGEREIMFLCYGASQKVAFDRLVLRLIDKILESLVLDINVERKGAYAEPWRMMTAVRKKINAAQILSGRGLVRQSLYILENAIANAREFELYDEMLLALRLQIQNGTILKGEKEYNRIYDQIKAYNIHRDALERATLTYTEYTLKNNFKSVMVGDMEWMDRSINQLERDYKITGSARIAYFLYNIYYGLYSQTGELKKSKANILALNSLMANSKAVFTEARMGINYTILAEIELQLENFDEAIGYACKGYELMKVKRVDQLQCLELIGMASFYQEEYVSAKALISECIRQGELIDDTPQRIGRRKLIMAWIHFMQGEFKTCLSLVMQENPVEKDSEGWNVGLRILTIMCLLELYLEDTAEKTVENLRQHIIRLRKEAKVHPRVDLIFNLFRVLENKGFQYKNLLPQIKEAIMQLESDEAKLKWIPYTFEIMPVHRWILSKIFKESFSLEHTKRKKEPKELKIILHRIQDAREL